MYVCMYVCMYVYMYVCSMVSIHLSIYVLRIRNRNKKYHISRNNLSPRMWVKDKNIQHPASAKNIR